MASRVAGAAFAATPPAQEMRYESTEVAEMPGEESMEEGKRERRREEHLKHAAEVVSPVAPQPDQATGIGGGREKKMNDHICKDPVTAQWEKVGGGFRGLAECLTEPPWLHDECVAGAQVVERLLECQVTDGRAFDAVRTIYFKVSAAVQAMGLKEKYKDVKEKYEVLQQSLNRLYRMAPGIDGRASSACQAPGAFENVHSNYRTLSEMAEMSERLVSIAKDRVGEAVTKIIKADLPEEARNRLGGFSAELGKAANNLGKPTDTAAKWVNPIERLQDAVASCDPEQVNEAYEALRGYVFGLSTAYGKLLCEMQSVKGLCQSAFFDALEVAVDEFGFLGAMVASSFGKLNLVSTPLGKQLKTLWQTMRTQLTGQLKQAFEYWQKQRLCLPTLCYDDATAGLRIVIEQGIADSDRFTSMHPSGDEESVRKHRRLVEKATDEVESLYCKVKGLPGSNTCVLTRLGSLTMQLQATLDRSTTDLVGSIKTIIETWKETSDWFKGVWHKEMKESLSPRVVQQLRTIACVFRWLENNVKTAAKVPTGPQPFAATPQTAVLESSSQKGELVVEFSDEQGQPFVGRRVQIVGTTGERSEAITDQNGVAKRYNMPSGVYTVFAEDDEAGIASVPVLIRVL